MLVNTTKCQGTTLIVSELLSEKQQVNLSSPLSPRFNGSSSDSNASFIMNEAFELEDDPCNLDRNAKFGL